MFAEHGCIADAVPVATFPDLDNLPIGGALSDRIGRKAILVAITVLAICMVVSGAVLTVVRAEFRAHADCAAVALVLLRHVQRRDGRGAR
jgi:nitrate/nitrite transporter NarK